MTKEGGMKPARPAVVFFALLVIAVACAACGGATGAATDNVYQVSTLGALSSGVMAGDVTCAELVENGDSGIGTFNGLDGEMVVLNGQVFQIPVDGNPREASPDELTPFAVVKSFDASESVPVENISGYENLKAFIDGVLPSRNFVYAFLVEGAFDSMKTRSVPGQKPPYPTLQEVVEKQAVFDLGTVTGTMVGFFFPEFLAGVNQAGYHLHFLTEDRGAGGHVLDCSVKEASLKLDRAGGLEMELLDTAGFREADVRGSG